MPENAPWVNIRAVAWALDEAPDVPASVVAVLIGVARHATEDGSDSYPSEATLARYARKTDRQIRRDLAALVERGLIRVPADQSAAAHIRADRRPTVYDLAFAPERSGTADDRTPTSGRRRPGGHPRPDVDDATTGHGGKHDRTPTSTEEDVEEERERRSLRATAEQTVRRNTDATEDETRELLRRIIAKHAPSSPDAYVLRMAEAGDLAQWLADLRTERPQQPPSVVRSGRECPHGTPDGATPHPHTQGPLCPLCRKHVRSCDRDPLYCRECQAIREAAGLPPDPRAVYDQAG